MIMCPECNNNLVEDHMEGTFEDYFDPTDFNIDCPLCGETIHIQVEKGQNENNY